MAKQLNARVQTKHDIEKNWAQAKTFIPKEGEIIIYMKDKTEAEVSALYQAYLDSLAELEAIEPTASTYAEKRQEVDFARKEYEEARSHIAPRFKVGDGLSYLSDLPFYEKPFVLADAGKDLSDCNYDKVAKEIVDSMKQYSNNDTLQFSDTKYKNGIGLGLLLDEENKNSSANNYFYNSGLIGVKEGTVNGTIDFALGSSPTTSTINTVSVPGLGSAAFRDEAVFAAASTTALAQQAIKLITLNEEGQLVYYLNDNTDEPNIIPGLGIFAYKNSIEYDDISIYLKIFTGATDETTGEAGLVPPPETSQQKYVLTGDGQWQDANSLVSYDQLPSPIGANIAEYRITETVDAGYCVYENGTGILEKTNARLLPCCRIVSDTYGFVMGENSQFQIPTAISGRVLAYTNENDEIEIGDCLCSGENGILSKMTREEITAYPDRIVGVVSEIPTYETWGINEIVVNKRVWVYVR